MLACGCRQLAGNVFDYAELTRRRSFRQAAETSRLAACATRKNPRASARFVARATKQNAGRQRGVVVRHFSRCAGSARVSGWFWRFAETIFKVREPEKASPTPEVRAGLALHALPGKDSEQKITKKTKRLPRLLQPWFPSVHRIDSYSRNPRFDSTKRKCRTSTWGCCPAFSRCLAKTELCVTVVFFELCSAFALQSLYGMPSYFNSFVIPSEAEESLTTNS